MSAEALKAEGNALLQKEDYWGAIAKYTEAIKLDPNNHVLFSNRSAAYCSLHKYKDAETDGRKCVQLNPKFVKGYSRVSAALQGQSRFDDAIAILNEGLTVDPSAQSLKDALAEVQSAKSAAFSAPGGGLGGKGSPFGQIFTPDIWAKLAMDPKLKPYLDEPDYCAKITQLVQNPQTIQLHLQDQRIMKTLLSLMNIGMPEEEDMPDRPSPSESKPKPSEEKKKEEEAKKKQAAAAAQSPEEVAANEHKEKGNALYKEKKFDEAIAEYEAAQQLDTNNIVYTINKAAALFEKGDFDACLAACDEAVAKGKEVKAPLAMLAKALGRKGTCLQKMERYEEAIAAYKTSMMETRTAEVLEKLNKCEAIWKKKKEEAYRDPEKAAAAKEEGNAFFKAGQFPEAIERYSEAIKRNPEEMTYYTNRASAFIKVMDYGSAIKDCDFVLQKEPQNTKAMLRKASSYKGSEQYHKAMEWFDKVLKLEPENEEAKFGKQDTMRIIMTSQYVGGSSSAEDKAHRQERAAKAMADPEIQAILTDPIMQIVLQDLSTNPSASQHHLQNPEISQKISKLVAAGVIGLSSR